MAWPINARYQTFVANVTTITAAFLNDIQDRIYHVIGGSRSLLKASIDAVGNVDSSAIPSGQLSMDGKSLEPTASVKFNDSTSAAGVGVGYNLRFETPSNGVGKVRLYEIRGGWVETTNAAWTGNVGAEWARDEGPNIDATMRRMMANDTGNICFGYYAINNPGATWAIANWTTILTAADDADIGDVGVGRDLIANRNLVAFTGGVSGATNVTAVAGNVIASAGDVVATLGSVTAGAAVSAGTTVTGAVGVTATTGNVEASAGVIRGRYIAGLGSTPTIVKNANLGGGASAAAMLTGTNSSGSFRLTCGTTPAAGVQATITFAHGGYSSAPKAVILTPGSATAAALAPAMYITANPGTGISATVFDVTIASALTDTIVYDWHYMVIA